MRPAGAQAGTTLLAAVVAICLAPGPAAAAKKPSAKLKTRTATVATTLDGQLVTATATCPKGHTAVGGGWDTGVAAVPGPAATDLIVVYESRRLGRRSWVVSGGREDTGSPGPPLDLTASVNCVRKPGKITEASSSGGLATAAGTREATAACNARKKAIAGGFQTAPPNLDTPIFYLAIVYENLVIGKRTWLASAISNVTAPPPVTTYVYCRVGDAPKVKSATVEVPPGAVVPPSAAVTPPCPPGSRPWSGGMRSLLDPINPGPPPIITNFSRRGDSIRVSVVDTGIDLDPSLIFFDAYCARVLGLGIDPLR